MERALSVGTPPPGASSGIAAGGGPAAFHRPDVSWIYCVAVGAVALAGLACTCLGFVCRSSKEERSQRSIARARTAMREGPDIWREDLRGMARYTSQALEQERHMTVGWWSLYTNKPWRREAGPALPEPDMTPNAEWLGGRSFPLGESRTKSVSRMIRALWRFMWGKAPGASRTCTFLSVVEGLCPAISSQTITCIVRDLVSGSEGIDFTGNGKKELNGIAWLVLLLFVYVGVQGVHDRAHFYYERDVPGASMRFELRKRLQWALLELEESAAATWPPGRCIAVLDIDVTQMVNLGWMSLFSLIREVTSCAALTLVLLYQSRHSLRMVLTVFAVMCLILTMALVNVRLRRANVLDLALRKQDWNYAWLFVAAAQLQQARARDPSRERGVPTAVKLHAEAALVNRKRAFHYFFLRLMSALSSSEMALIAEAAVILIFGLSAIKGVTPVSSAVGVISAMKSIRSNQSMFVTTWLDIIEGYSSLLNIRRVFGAQLDEEDFGESSESDSTEPAEGSAGSEVEV